jgi:hypothetical protein
MCNAERHYLLIVQGEELKTCHLAAEEGFSAVLSEF